VPLYASSNVMSITERSLSHNLVDTCRAERIIKKTLPDSMHTGRRQLE
jgi:hypothetical protein